MKNSSRTRYFNKKYEGKKSKEVTCYECKKSGHIRSDCPQIQKQGIKGKKKAFEASWDD